MGLLVFLCLLADAEWLRVTKFPYHIRILFLLRPLRLYLSCLLPPNPSKQLHLLHDIYKLCLGCSMLLFVTTYGDEVLIWD